MTTSLFPVADAIDRLVAKAPLLELVGTAADLRTAQEQRPNRSPAGYVLCEERGGEVKYTGPVTHQNVDVALQLVLFVRNVRQERTGAGARALMDQVIAQARQAWIGWAPGDAFEAVTFRAGKDEIYDGGWLVTQQIFRSAYRFAHQVMP